MANSIAGTITQAASKQTYYTIRLLVDRPRLEDAFRTYGYFRWVDDVIDADEGSGPERRAFIERQKSLLDECYRGEFPQDASLQEKMLVELIQHDQEPDSGLQTYLRNMIRVMDFDARRRGRLVSLAELNEYTHWLASAVTEAMHHFIGHGEFAPRDHTRYLAVTAAHITHLLRDTYDDVRAGYYNIPREVLDAYRIGPHDLHSEAYHAWVESRVKLAREYFRAGMRYLGRVQNARCRLAGFAYTARFEWLLDTLERESYTLRPEYSERKRIGNGLRMAWQTLSSLMNVQETGQLSQPAASHPASKL